MEAHKVNLLLNLLRFLQNSLICFLMTKNSHFLAGCHSYWLLSSHRSHPLFLSSSLFIFKPSRTGWVLVFVILWSLWPPLQPYHLCDWLKDLGPPKCLPFDYPNITRLVTENICKSFFGMAKTCDKGNDLSVSPAQELGWKILVMGYFKILPTTVINILN